MSKKFFGFVVLFALVAACPAFALPKAECANPNTTVDIADVALAFAWVSKGGVNFADNTTNRTSIITTTQRYQPAVTDITQYPTLANWDFNGDSVVDIKDVAIAFAWVSKGGVNFADNTTNRASVLTTAQRYQPAITAITTWPGADAAGTGTTTGTTTGTASGTAVTIDIQTQE